MKIKQIPEDFIVNEIYDLKIFEERDEDRKDYFYFKLIKKNYSQIRALEVVARVFNISKKLINFSGTKDKVGITSQLISIYNLKEDNLEKNLNYLNDEIKDLELEYLGKFKGRINLGDNLGNAFEILVRDVLDEEINLALERIEEIKEKGLLNFFESQRFGYANNSHIVGKFLLQNKPDLALFEILTSCPKNGSDDLKVYTDFIRENWEQIILQNLEVLNQIEKIIPKFLSNDLKVIKHLYKYKNDFYGAFRLIPKKIRTLYINAYQSYLFNLVLENFKELPDELELFNAETNYSNLKIQEFILDILKKDDLEQKDFLLLVMPELKLRPVSRKTRVFPQNINYSNIEEDELNEGKKKILIKFELGSGEYATNVINYLFRKN